MNCARAVRRTENVAFLLRVAVLERAVANMMAVVAEQPGWRRSDWTLCQTFAERLVEVSMFSDRMDCVTGSAFKTAVGFKQAALHLLNTFPSPSLHL
jgi:hypothetical protein